MRQKKRQVNFWHNEKWSHQNGRPLSVSKTQWSNYFSCNKTSFPLGLSWNEPVLTFHTLSVEVITSSFGPTLKFPSVSPHFPGDVSPCFCCIYRRSRLSRGQPLWAIKTLLTLSKNLQRIKSRHTASRWDWVWQRFYYHSPFMKMSPNHLTFYFGIMFETTAILFVSVCSIKKKLY